MVWWLRLPLPSNAGNEVLIPGQGTKIMLCGVAKTKQTKSCHVTYKHLDMESLSINKWDIFNIGKYFEEKKEKLYVVIKSERKVLWLYSASLSRKTSPCNVLKAKHISQRVCAKSLTLMCLCDHLHVESKKYHKWIHLQNRNRLMDIEKKKTLWFPKGKR